MRNIFVYCIGAALLIACKPLVQAQTDAFGNGFSQLSVDDSSILIRDSELGINSNTDYFQLDAATALFAVNNTNAQRAPKNAESTVIQAENNHTYLTDTSAAQRDILQSTNNEQSTNTHEANTNTNLEKFSLREYVNSIPHGGDIASLSDETLARNFYSLMTVLRGIGSEAAESLRREMHWDAVFAKFDLPGGEIMEVCVQYNPIATCGIFKRPAPFVSGEEVRELVSYAKSTIAEYGREISSRGFGKLKGTYQLIFEGPCSAIVPKLGEQKVTQKYFLFILQPAIFEGIIVHSTVVVFSRDPLATTIPSRVMVGKLNNGTVNLKGFNFDCTMMMKATD